ncbi:hypothetical protein BAAM1489_03955 [Bifidobacterium animalis subsp. animalis MCC 1489]|uniref:BspA family leucine-rich repeat surface protein n=1 Tax=Bifidobacterium animalis subsp. animalis IM386 TaxID=1402194 RepID=A0AAV2W143_9BIFI|nr:BspA family leucine-rich repeat surface protein [Bifidobacterium animalis]AFI63467.1 hypothetical protein BANAN_06295 [Bifidobacterium animalis subsp. animalis ATCC 25527]AYN24094.1 hypothetical protein CNCMI4602_1249 [Bifidobacterium animalis subsp. animalis]KFI41647.1 adhesin-like protein [Bifidobacterium animalis subsp. animalis]KOA63609.1 hypothetical protein BAAM1489_03955 [Bifidobacterium animalis subsp. animalis MCC 1489]CDI67332.1 Uncharacterized protein BANIM336_00641 [Bifidobacter
MKKFQNFLALLLAATFVLSAGMFTDAAYAKQVAKQAPSISENHELEEEPAPTSSPSDEASPSPNASPADASPSAEANSSEAQTGDGNASESDGANARSGQVHQWSASELNALRSSAEHSGKYGDVGWWIKNGVLHLGTADWQTLGDYDSRRNGLSYWNDYRDIISAVSIDYRIKGSKNMSYLFFGLGKLESITVNQTTAPYGWWWDGVESLENICNNDVSLTDISAFSHIEYDSHNPQRPKSFKYAFKHCEKLQDLTPLKDWMFENMWGTGVEGMFSDCYSLKDLTPISYREVNGRRYWNMDFAQTFLDMFKNCRSLEKLDGLGDWNVGNVTNMQNMFQGCSNLTDLSAISNWQVGNVQQMVSMFEACTSLIDLAPLNGWKPDAALTMASLFSGDGRIHDVSALKDWSVGRVTDTSNMFANVNTISPVAQMSFAPLANWHFGYNALTQYTGMFSGVKNICEEHIRTGCASGEQWRQGTGGRVCGGVRHSRMAQRHPVDQTGRSGRRVHRALLGVEAGVADAVEPRQVRGRRRVCAVWGENRVVGGDDHPGKQEFPRRQSAARRQNRVPGSNPLVRRQW